MPEGVIAGGWNFVIAAYAVSALVFLGYTWSLRRRWTREQNHEENDR
jgi:hypothetical protein